MNVSTAPSSSASILNHLAHQVAAGSSKSTSGTSAGDAPGPAHHGTTQPTHHAPKPKPNPHAPHGATRLARSKSVLGSTKEGAHLLSLASQQHVAITVLSGAQFRSRFGDAGGVTTSDHVYVPRSSLGNAQEGALILGHELTHATDGWNDRITTKTEGYTDEARAFYNEGVVAHQLGLNKSSVQGLVGNANFIYTASGAERSRQSIEHTVANNAFYQHAYAKLPN